eukprot:6010519-Pleurochrysis_carterae.AAC.3
MRARCAHDGALQMSRPSAHTGSCDTSMGDSFCSPSVAFRPPSLFSSSSLFTSCIGSYVFPCGAEYVRPHEL